MTGSQARALATRLAAIDDRELAAIFRARGVPAQADWSDLFDAADALLDDAWLDRAVTGLSADQAAALEGADGAVPPGPVREQLSALALLDDAGRPYPEVLGALERATRTVPPSTPPGDAASDEHEAERAFTAVGSLSDILTAAYEQPLGRIGAGVLSVQERRRLIDIGAVEDGAAADDLVAIAERCGLLTVEGRQWLISDEALPWRRAGTAARWGIVAVALRESLPPGMRTPAGGWIPPSRWPGAYPFDPAWPARAAQLRTLLVRWALLAEDGTPASWARSVSEGAAPDTAALQLLLPPEVDRVYLQNDLSAIAPGPLAPEVELRLRTMARRESRAQASTYRFSAETLAEALARGESAESMTAFLTELSLTGIPQPLAYEIERAAARDGALRVSADESGHTVICAEDAALLRTVCVDQSLRSLGLVLDGSRLRTRASTETAFWMLADARYPVVAVDAHGRRREIDRRHRAGPPAAPAEPDHSPLIARLRQTQGDDAESAWLARELEQAVRDRATVTVTVRMPEGTERDLTIEATGLGGGRLRGRDRAADVERTLPMSHIVRVRAG